MINCRGTTAASARRVLRHLTPWAVMAVLCGYLVAPLRRSDLMVFLQAGADVLDGVDPYTALDDPFLYGGSAFVYPWWTALAFAPLSVLPTGLADAVWTGGSIGAVVLACRLAGLRGLLPVLAVLTAATTLRGLQVGSLNAFLLLGCVVAWRYRERASVAGWAVALVVGAKVFLFPLLIWLLVSGRTRALRAAVLGLLVLVGGSFLLGPVGPVDYASMLRILGEHEGGQGFSLHRLAATLISDAAAGPVCAVVAAAVISRGAVMRRRHGEAGDLLLFSCCVVAALALTPIVWSHYVLLGFAPLLLHRARLRWLLLASVVSWLVAEPAHTVHLLHASASWHISLLFASLLAMLAALHPTPSRGDAPRPERQTVSPSR